MRQLQKEGDAGLETWASLDAARHGNGATWIPGVYDPETKLYMFGTGNPTPSYTTGRGEGDNLFTSCLVALNVETGKMAWYFRRRRTTRTTGTRRRRRCCSTGCSTAACARWS